MLFNNMPQQLYEGRAMALESRVGWGSPGARGTPKVESVLKFPKFTPRNIRNHLAHAQPNEQDKNQAEGQRRALSKVTQLAGVGDEAKDKSCWSWAIFRHISLWPPQEG